MASKQVSCQAGIILERGGHKKKIILMIIRMVKEKKLGKIIYLMIALLKKKGKYPLFDKQNLIQNLYHLLFTVEQTELLLRFQFQQEEELDERHQHLLLSPGEQEERHQRRQLLQEVLGKPLQTLK